MSLRTAFALTLLIGTVYATAALAMSPDWRDFAAGIAIACIGLIGFDYCDTH